MEKIENGILEGIAKYNEGEYEQALSIFDTLIGTLGDDILALFYKGNTLGALGNFDDAITCFDKILGKDPKNDKAIKAKEIFESIEKNSFSQKLSCPKVAESAMPQISMSAPASAGPVSRCEDYQMSKKASGSMRSFGKLTPGESVSSNLKKDIQLDLMEEKYETLEGNESLYDFLKSNEVEDFFEKGNINQIEVSGIIDNYGTNSFDKEKITQLIKEKKSLELREFIKKVKLRNSILDYLADNNVLPPRKYNTILSQIQNINAEFALAYLMFNLGEQRYNEIMNKLGEKVDNTYNNQIKENESEKVSILKVIANFFIGIFSFEKAFINENNKLKYFKYLFIFLSFLSVVTLIGYGIKNDAFKADVKVIRKVEPNGAVDSVKEIGRDNIKKVGHK